LQQQGLGQGGLLVLVVVVVVVAAVAARVTWLLRMLGCVPSWQGCWHNRQLRNWGRTWALPLLVVVGLLVPHSCC
jgi:hypothetical protein